MKLHRKTIFSPTIIRRVPRGQPKENARDVLFGLFLNTGKGVAVRFGFDRAQRLGVHIQMQFG